MGIQINKISMKLVAAQFFLGSALAQFSEIPWKVDNFDNLDNWYVDVVPNSNNNEYQYYTDRPENVRLEDGILKIIPKREKYAHRDYTSGKLRSKFYRTFGKIEIRAKTPNGRGLWPAIWMMPQFSVYGGWPASGEIDIYEGRGQSPWGIQSTIHYGGLPCCDKHRYTGSGIIYQDKDTTADFNNYSVEWTPKNMIFKFNGEQKYEVSIDKIIQEGTYSRNGQPFDKDFYLILNVAVGGDFLDGPDWNDEWFYPGAEMHVDWVKWYDYVGGENHGCECKANAEQTDDSLCGSAEWACFEQNYAPNMYHVCGYEFTHCCIEGLCTHEEVVDVCSKVFEQYDEQIRDDNSCDFNGNAYRVCP